MSCDDYDRMEKMGAKKGSIASLLKQKADKKKNDRKLLIIAQIKDKRRDNEDS
jgi:hypothetical protein